MLIAFLLNLFFSVFEFFGGMISGSYAVMSDALHDAADSLGIGLSLIFEKKSKGAPDRQFTYGYGNYSLIGALFTTLILLTGSAIIIINAIPKIFNPTEIKYKEMMFFAIIGILVNAAAAFVTKGKESANQRAVNLHMLEDVLGWICVLAGALIIHYTGLYIVDSVLSISVSLFIIFHAIQNIKDIFCVFLEKTPNGINVDETKKALMSIDGVIDIHHIHIRKHASKDIIATMHVVTDEDNATIKQKVREELEKHGINHATLELENTNEMCWQADCSLKHGHFHSHCHTH